MRSRPVRMLARTVVIVVLLCAPASAAHANAAKITAEKTLSSRVLELTISTPAFTAPTHVLVDLPTGYDADPSRRWPVTYVLAGTMNTYKSFNDVVDGVKLTAAYPSIVVSPNGDSGYWSDWFNAGAFGAPQYETYVVDQLIPLIDARLRTNPDRSQRAALGISMGGYGSMMIAAHHPDLFSAAATLSGAVDSNLPTLGAALTASPAFQGGSPDAINGPRATQEIRWHAGNPTDLAANLGGLDLQVRTANGIPNPGIGEQPLSADSVSCVIEGGVHMGSTSLHDTLTALGIPHLWKDYGAGCHTAANFQRELTDTFRVFAATFAAPTPPPASFNLKSIRPVFDVWGWHVEADPKRALEFLQLSDVSAGGLSVSGSGVTTITTPPLFRGLRRVDLVDPGGSTALVPDSAGRLKLDIDLGPAHTLQQDTTASRAAGDGSPGYTTSRRVTFAPYARLLLTRTRRIRTGIATCVRSAGPAVSNVVIAVRDTHGRPVTNARRISVRSRVRCLHFPVARRLRARHVSVSARGIDPFAHRVTAVRRVR